MRIARRLALIPLVISAFALAQTAPVSIATLRQNFLNPPNDSRPMVRWWWFGTAVEKPEILRELQQMKADGIGGVELAFVYPQVVDDPSKNLVNEPFVSPEMLDNVRYAQVEARKLGLRVDVTLGSGWPYGGPATTLAEAATRLRTAEIPVAANATSIVRPALDEGETFISAAIVNLRSASSNDPTHCGFAYGNVCGSPTVPTPHTDGHPSTTAWDPSTAQPLNLSASTITFPSSDKPRTALFFIQSHTKQVVKRAAVGAEGWVLDPFSHDAVATHLKAVGDPLVKAFGTTPPYAIFSDSLEAYGADWTPNLPAEFQKRRGYDLLPHLPELVAGGTPDSERVKHDWGQTLTELVNQNYLTQINNWAIAHHTKFRSQTYGEPAVNLSSQNLVALAEGEGPQWRAFSTLRWATSANHVFGHNITSGETFTWLHSPVFRATPLDMKAEADIDFIMGENQLIFHGWPYSPPQVGEPGWSLYAAAVFNDHNPWHPVMPDVTRYIARLSYLMRQGQPVNQVAVLLPTDDAWASFTPAHVTVTGAMQKLVSPALMSAILSAGYNVDFIDADAINRQGVHHKILVLPPTNRIPLETLRKIQEYVSGGGKAIAVGHAPTITPEGRSSEVLSRLAKGLFSEEIHTLVHTEAGLGDALHKAAKPDLSFISREGPSSGQPVQEIGFIRRKLPNADIYFVTNTSNYQVDAIISLVTRYLHGETWSPDTGTTSPVGPACVPLHLAPYESRVFVFSGPEASSASPTASDIGLNYCGGEVALRTDQMAQIADLSKNWQLHFTSLNKTEDKSELTDWTANPATLHYSGEGVYARDFTLSATSETPLFLEVEGGSPLPGAPNSPPEHPALGPNGLPNPLITRPGPGMHAYYDPPIREAAIVYINAQRAGSLWHPPYRLDVTKLLKPGQNHIEIHVYNTAINAWAAQPPHDYKPLIAKYGDRFQMQDLDKVKPVPSGILGQIHLVTAPQ